MMRLILVIVTIAQLKFGGSEPINNGRQDFSNIPRNLNVPTGIYELRRISEGELRSINPDRIVTVGQDQTLQKAQEGMFRHGYQAMHGSDSYQMGNGNMQRAYQPEMTSAPGAIGRQDYTQREYQRGPQLLQDYQQNPGSNSAFGNQDFGPRGYQHQQMPPENPQNYHVYSENTQSGLMDSMRRQQEIPSDYQVVNENSQNMGRQDMSSYQVVNENPQTGEVSITLPGYQDAENAQDYLQSQGFQQRSQQNSEYQVVNEAPPAHMMSVSQPGTTNVYFPPQKPATADSRQGFMPSQYVYIPPHGDSGKSNGPHYNQSPNELFKPYERPYMPQGQQQEVQHDVRNLQQGPMQIPMPFMNGIDDGQQRMDPQLWDMIRNSRTATKGGRARVKPEEKQTVHRDDYSRGN